eukprot:scaffold241_cov242-Pinguiococcus_pyrenoidosus.AAC.12
MQPGCCAASLKDEAAAAHSREYKTFGGASDMVLTAPLAPSAASPRCEPAKIVRVVRSPSSRVCRVNFSTTPSEDSATCPSPSDTCASSSARTGVNTCANSKGSAKRFRPSRSNTPSSSSAWSNPCGRFRSAPPAGSLVSSWWRRSRSRRSLDATSSLLIRAKQDASTSNAAADPCLVGTRGSISLAARTAIARTVASSS